MFPAVDLHLLPGAQVPLKLYGPVNNGWAALTTQPGFTIALATPNPVVALTTTGGVTGPVVPTLTATAVGVHTGVLQIAWTGQPTLHVAFRATVHHAIRRLFVPWQTLTLETGRDDRVLSVYAQFETATGERSTHDISSLPFLKYPQVVVAGTPAVAIDEPTGRVTSGASPGRVRVTVSIDSALVPAGPTAIVDLDIVAQPIDREILEYVHRGTAPRKKSILFLSEGFTDGEQQRFRALVRDMTTRVLASVQPYRRLREAFDVYMAFVPSVESGVSVAPPIAIVDADDELAVPILPDWRLAARDFTLEEVLETLGHPSTSPHTYAPAVAAMATLDPARALSFTTFQVWRSLTTPPEAPRVRETAFGIMMGERHHGTAATANPTAPIDPALDLLRERGPNRFPTFDDRRLPDLAVPGAWPGDAHLRAQRDFVGTLRLPGGPVGFGKVWNWPGDSWGLVIYVVNADHFGGAAHSGKVAMSIGEGIRVYAPPSLLVPGLRDVELATRAPTAPAVALGFVGVPIDPLVDLVAHELAHTWALGFCHDEYVEKARAPDAVEAGRLLERPNVQPLADATIAPSAAIVSAKLKWNWERVEAAAVIGQVTNLTGARMTLFVGDDIDRWPPDTIGRTAFVREERLSRTHSTDLTIRDVQYGAQTIELEDPAGAASATAIATAIVPRASKIVMPRLASPGVSLRIVDAAVFPALAAGPFEASGAGCAPPATPGPPATIDGVTLPANANQLVAAYESGATFQCGVIRPAAECKMRHNIHHDEETPTDFCFACKYVIVDAVDCAALASLDRDYPA